MSSVQTVISILDGLLNGTIREVIETLPLNGIEKQFYTFYLANQAPYLADTHKSQLSQDLWVALLLNCWSKTSASNTSGYYVEFGGFDGFNLSNSYMFEKNFNWKGIIVEPNQFFSDRCREHRSCIIDNRCVWSESRKTFDFNVVPNAPELGTLETFENGDCHTAARQARKQLVSVETVSLLDLLGEHQAPRIIDYLSIDTEGSEFEILNAFDFKQYTFKIISVEHNFTDSREKICELLLRNEYMRLPRNVSYCDDMYINTKRSPHLSRINHWLMNP